jgi:hypothetical protein
MIYTKLISKFKIKLYFNKVERIFKVFYLNEKLFFIYFKNLNFNEILSFFQSIKNLFCEVFSKID